MTERQYIKNIHEMSFEIYEFYQRIKDISDYELIEVELEDIAPNFYNKWHKLMNGRVGREKLRTYGKIITLLNDEFTYIGKEIGEDTSTKDNSVFLINGKKF